jgi:hypothetical protein
MFHEQEMKSIAQNISRYYGDRIGRARLNSKAELQSSKPPTGNAIITAEYTPEISVSGSARYFNIELNENDVQLDDLSEYQQLANDGVLCGIMQSYIEWIKNVYLDDESAFVKTLEDVFLKYRKFYLDRLCANRIKFHNRTPDMLAHLKIGFAFLLVFLKSKNQINKSELDKFEKVFDEIIGYKFVNFGKMMDFIKAGDDANTAFEKAQGQYGRVADAVKIVDPRKE